MADELATSDVNDPQHRNDFKRLLQRLAVELPGFKYHIEEADGVVKGTETVS